MRHIAPGVTLGLVLAVIPAMAATAEQIASYEIDGISLNKSIEEISAALTGAGYSETPPDTLQVGAVTLKWTFEKSLDDGGSASFVIFAGQGHVTSIRYEITHQSVQYDVKAEYNTMEEFAGDDAGRCKIKRGETALCKFSAKNENGRYSFFGRVQPHAKTLTLERK
ncbi:MAG: hypothetical protein R3344_07880 [Acidobacteriota bacterium]|nr:hypothetical protein [Acidobacteriota bacterium]